jgi:hypothetical protein
MLEASPADLIAAVREQGFEGIVAKRRDSPCKPGQRSAVWQKMRVRLSCGSRDRASDPHLKVRGDSGGHLYSADGVT